MNVVFVAPFFREATVRFVAAVAQQPDVRMVLVSQDHLEGVPPALRSRLAGHYRVDNALDVNHLLVAVAKAQRFLGSVDRLLGALEHIQIQLGVVRDRLSIPGHGERVARNFRDKAQMKRVLQAEGVPCARHAEVLSAGAARRFASEVGFPLVLKPREGAAAVSTWRIENAQELDDALARCKPSPDNPAVIEEFIVARERSFEVFTVDGEPVWTSVTRYDPPPLRVLENPWIQWTVLLPREVDTDDASAIREAGLAALRALGMQTGLSHMEWFWRQDGSVAVSEVAARPPGAQILALNSYAHDVDMYDLWARLCVRGDLPPMERRYAAGVAFFRGQGHGRVTSVEGLEQAQQQVGHMVVESKLPQVGQWSSPSYEGEGYAIVRHEDTAEVERALKTLIQTVKIKLAS